MKYKIMLRAGYLFLLVSIIASSCGNKKQNLQSTGGTAEVLVVYDKVLEALPIKDSLLLYLSSPRYGLNQDEAEFDLVFMPRENFTETYRTHHSILLISVTDSVKKFEALAIGNPWASPQIVMKLRAPVADSVMTGLYGFRKRIRKELLEAEHKRLAEILEEKSDAVLSDTVSRFSGLPFNVPEGYSQVAKYSDFIWLRTHYTEGESSLCISLPELPGDADPAEKELMALVDSLGRERLHGTHDSMYVRVSGSYDTRYQVQRAWQRTTYVLHGLWEMKGDKMGGPFVCYLLQQPGKKSWVMLFAYIYLPNKPKRDLMLQLEAVIEDAIYKNTAAGRK